LRFCERFVYCDLKAGPAGGRQHHDRPGVTVRMKCPERPPDVQVSSR
jgi:hypothetical protein